MANGIRTFGLLFYKNLLIRKRHWKMTIFLQCLVPIALFVLIQTMRDFSVNPPRVINESTYYPIETKEELVLINREFTVLFCVPQNSYTESIIKDVRMCLKLPQENVKGFATETDMIEAYTVLEVKSPTSEVIAIVFEQYNTTDIKYKIRHPFKIPNILFQRLFDQPAYNVHTIYFNAMPFAQLQICVDETLINYVAASQPTMDIKAVHAVKGISMDLYKGQITALLGHNGAGKTTLMSMLTDRVISATEGKVLMNGRNIKKHLELIRNDLGLCPQQNIVFPDLGVFEQLEFFGLLKDTNKTRKEIQKNINFLLDKLKLKDKRNVLPSTLSGAQKRRLCLGIALVGDASIIILDEPTSGMDPETRRDIWDIILKIKEKKNNFD